MTRTAACLTIVLALCVDVHAGARQAGQKVREGIAHFRDEEYEQAAKSFAEADVSRPDDPCIAFDRACALAAQGEADKAAELFEQAALARDRSLAVRSRYNLGVMAAEKARALFGDKPQEAVPEVRTQGLALLAEAVKHYRDCLDLDENHADARHNLELIRLWIKHVEELWRQRDRQKEREEKGLLEFLLMIDTQQRALRSTARSLAGQPDSPQRRQALVTAESSQRTLAEEIDPLKEKIEAEVGSPQPSGQSPQQPPGPTVSPEAAEKVVEMLTGLADEARGAMLQAADVLHGGSPGDAAGRQTEAVEKLDRIYQAVVPFPNLVQRAIATEQGLVDQVAPAAENNGRDAEQEDQPDFDDLTWNQRLLAGWAGVLAPKAEQGLKGLENVDPARLQDLGAMGMASPPPGTAQPAGPNAKAKPDPEVMKKQLEGLKQSMEKAIELGPEVHDLAVEAADQLAEKHPTDALPKQQEALKLLREIADPLPTREPQQQGEKKQDPRHGNQKQDQQQQGDQRQERQQGKRNPQDLSQRQAESVLRKVRERERQRRELDKELQRRMYRPGAVDRDW